MAREQAEAHAVRGAGNASAASSLSAEQASAILQALRTALSLQQQGDLTRAEALYRQVLEIDPHNADALHLLGVVAYEVGQHEVAVAFISEAVKHSSSLADAHSHLGLALQALGRRSEAIACYRRAITLQPREAEAYNNLGAALQEAGELDEAVTTYRAALTLRPAYAEAHNNISVALRMQGKLNDAIASCREALNLKPDYADAHNNLGSALREQGKLLAAIDCYGEAIRCNPDLAKAHYNLGGALRDKGDRPEAIKSYARAIQCKPNHAEAHNGAGVCLHEQGYTDEALRCYRQAVRLKPDYVEAHTNIGIALQDKHDLPGAVESFREALRHNPDDAKARSNLMSQLQLQCDWAGLDELFEQARRTITSDPIVSVSPWAALAIPTSPAEQLACNKKWSATCVVPADLRVNGMAFDFSPGPTDILRIGYLSSDFRQHVVADLMAEVFELHDRSRVEVRGYSLASDDGSAMRRRLVEACDAFVDLVDLSAIEAARRIYEDGVDILIDLNGHTRGCRTQILAMRPAPIQVNYCGFPGTIGADFIDYIITDRFISPPEQQHHYTERFAYLPDTLMMHDRKRAIAEATPSRTDCRLPETGFVFCCFNNTNKITPHVFDVWMRLLAQTPGSVLWLVATNEWVAPNLRREASVRGIDPARLVFGSRVPLSEHLARQRLADLFLDTLPFGAHSTAANALWAGVPLLTCVGDTFAARVGGSLLQAIGLPELITYALDDYEDLALRLAHEPTRLAGLRERLAANRDTHPLFDSSRYTRNLDDLYRRMWDSYLEQDSIASVRRDGPIAVHR